jgi:hypothetical protein
MSLDPVTSNPDHDKVVFENDRVRVLEIHRPAWGTNDAAPASRQRHVHRLQLSEAPRRRRNARDVAMEAGAAGWLPAQEHHGVNIGDTPTHVIFVELKGSPADTPTTALGPQGN